MASKVLNYEEFMQYAKKYYDKGGDGFYECWDEKFFNDYVGMFGPLTKAKAREMFKMEYDVRRDYEATAW